MTLGLNLEGESVSKKGAESKLISKMEVVIVRSAWN